MWLWGEGKPFLSVEGSTCRVAVQSSFNPGAKTMCSESPEHTEM